MQQTVFQIFHAWVKQKWPRAPCCDLQRVCSKLPCYQLLPWFMSISWSCEIGVSRHTLEGSLQKKGMSTLVYITSWCRHVEKGLDQSWRPKKSTCDVWFGFLGRQTFSCNIHIPWGKKHRRLNQVMMQKKGTIHHHNSRDIWCMIWCYQFLSQPPQNHPNYSKPDEMPQTMMIPRRRWCPPVMWTLV